MPGEHSDLDHVLEQVGQAVRDKRCILFLGAGVHWPPSEDSPYDYPASQRPPSGKELSLHLAERCDFGTLCPDEHPDNLQRVSMAYEISRGRRALVDEIVKAVDDHKSPSPMLVALARLDFPVIITTNYDQLLEKALRLVGKEPRCVHYEPEPRPTQEYDDERADAPIIYKLHGDTQRRNLVVTDEDYIQFVLRMSDKEPWDPIPVSLKTLLKRWTTVFIGYSLLDYNLRLLFKSLRWRVDPANLPYTYSVDFRPDPLVLDVWQNQRRHVTFVAQDLWWFVPRLYEAATGRELGS